MKSKEYTELRKIVFIYYGMIALLICLKIASLVNVTWVGVIVIGLLPIMFVFIGLVLTGTLII